MASFKVTYRDEQRSWRMPAFLSPLFRWIHESKIATEQNHRAQDVGRGAKTVTDRFRTGDESGSDHIVVCAAGSAPTHSWGKSYDYRVSA